MMTILHTRHQKLQDDPGQLFILDSNGLTPAGLSEKVCSCIYPLQEEGIMKIGRRAQ